MDMQGENFRGAPAPDASVVPTPLHCNIIYICNVCCTVYLCIYLGVHHSTMCCMICIHLCTSHIMLCIYNIICRTLHQFCYQYQGQYQQFMMVSDILTWLDLGLYQFLVCVSVSGQYQQVLIVSELVKYVIQVPISNASALLTLK